MLKTNGFLFLFFFPVLRPEKKRLDEQVPVSSKKHRKFPVVVSSEFDAAAINNPNCQEFCSVSQPSAVSSHLPAPAQWVRPNWFYLWCWTKWTMIIPIYKEWPCLLIILLSQTVTASKSLDLSFQTACLFYTRISSSSSSMKVKSLSSSPRGELYFALSVSPSWRWYWGFSSVMEPELDTE